MNLEPLLAIFPNSFGQERYLVNDLLRNLIVTWGVNFSSLIYCLEFKPKVHGSP